MTSTEVRRIVWTDDDIEFVETKPSRKYSLDQPRDERGRFGSGDGGAIAQELGTAHEPTLLDVPKTLASAPLGVAARIRDMAENGGWQVPSELSASWQNSAAWEMIQTDEARALMDPEATYPERYEPNKVGNLVLKQGEVETHIAEGNEFYGRPPRLYDIIRRPPDMSIDEAQRQGYGFRGIDELRVPNSERPPQSLYRVMSTAEYDIAKERGYIQTDERMNLGDEGTVTSFDSTGSFYEPGTSSGNSDYRIVRIGYRDEDGWILDRDTYVKTHQPIPFDRVEAVTSVLPNTRNEKAFKVYDESQHPRDDRGRWTDAGGGGGATITDRPAGDPHDLISQDDAQALFRHVLPNVHVVFHDPMVPDSDVAPAGTDYRNTPPPHAVATAPTRGEVEAVLAGAQRLVNEFPNVAKDVSTVAFMETTSGVMNTNLEPDGAVIKIDMSEMRGAPKVIADFYAESHGLLETTVGMREVFTGDVQQQLNTHPDAETQRRMGDAMFESAMTHEMAHVATLHAIIETMRDPSMSANTTTLFEHVDEARMPPGNQLERADIMDDVAWERPSRYGQQDPAEYWAETVTAQLYGMTGRLPHDTQQIMDGLHANTQHELSWRNWPDVPSIKAAVRRAMSTGDGHVDTFGPGSIVWAQGLLAWLKPTKKYSPDQPRDDHGRFGEVGGDLHRSGVYFTPSEHQGGHPDVGELNRVLNPAYDEQLKPIEAQLKSAFPNARIDIEGIHPKLGQEVADRSTKFATEFPAVAEEVKAIEIGSFYGEDDTETFAYVDPTYTRIQLNERYYSDPEAMQAVANDTARAVGKNPPWHPLATTASTIDHELGHILEGHAYTEWGPVANMPALSSLWSDPSSTHMISGYAEERGGGEAFAEAFSIRQGKGIDAIADPSLRHEMELGITRMGGDGTKAAQPLRRQHTCPGYIPKGIAQKYLGKKSFKFREDQARNPAGSPEGGRFVSEHGGDTTTPTQDTTLLARVGTTVEHHQPSAKSTAYALSQAKLYETPGVDNYGGAGTPYENSEEWSRYANVERPITDPYRPPDLQEYIPPDHWIPGTVESLSEAATRYQESFDEAEHTQIAADALLGYAMGEGEGYTSVYPSNAAYARELLNAMAGNGPEGAASGYTVDSVSFGDVIGVQHFGEDDLARGFDDPDGEILSALQDAHDSGSTVAWSMASFVQGNGNGEAFMQEMISEGLESDPNHATYEDPNTGEPVPQNGDEIAAASALRFTTAAQQAGVPEYITGGDTGPTNPVLIQMSNSDALRLDGRYEAIAGGKFAVDEIRPATADERARWNAYEYVPTDTPLTVVKMHQVENVKLPGDVQFKAATVPTFIAWRDGSLRPRTPYHRKAMVKRIKSYKFVDTQPRDDHGRWVSDAGIATPNLDEMQRRIREEGGFTYDPTLGDYPTTGVTVRADGFDSKIVDADRFFSDDAFGEQQLYDFFDQHAADFVDDPALDLGAWLDTEHNEVVFDMVERMTGTGARERAIRAGIARNEQGVFDLATGDYIETHGSGNREQLAAKAARDRSAKEALERDVRSRAESVRAQHARADEAELRALIANEVTPISEAELRAQLDLPVDVDEPDWTVVDEWLDRNELKSLDVLEAVHRELHPDEPFRHVKYSPDQPRDYHGRFGTVDESTTTVEQPQSTLFDQPSLAPSITIHDLNARVADAAARNHIDPPELRNLSQMDGRGRAVFATAYEYMADHYPAATATLKSVEVTDGNYRDPATGTESPATSAATALEPHFPEGATAGAVLNGTVEPDGFIQRIELPGAAWGQEGYDDREKMNQESYRMGGNVTASHQDVIMHEMGHVLSNAMAIRETPTVLRMGPELFSRAKNELSFFESIPEDGGPAALLPRMIKLSGYATSQPEEGLAEAYVDRLRQRGDLPPVEVHRASGTRLEADIQHDRVMRDFFNVEPNSPEARALDSKATRTTNKALDEMEESGKHSEPRHS